MLFKQIVAIRRKPDMTRKEYFDHHFRVHGTISDEPEDKDHKPHKYIQTHIFDSAFGSRANGPPNSNHSWVGRDDVTELYFRDWKHIKSCFTSEHVKTRVGPDGAKFADSESTIMLMAGEKPMVVDTSLASTTKRDSTSGDATVAMLFIGTKTNIREGAELDSILTPLLVETLRKHCQDAVWGAFVNVGVVSSHFDLNSYFGGGKMSQYALAYKVLLKDAASVPAFRVAQHAFYASAADHIDTHTCFVLFGKEALILDVGEGIKFDPGRQPTFSDLPGETRLIEKSYK